MVGLFTLLYFAGMVVQVILRTPYERQRRRVRKPDRRVTISERIVLAGLTAGMFLLPLIYSVSSWLDFANYRLAPSTTAGAGAVGALLLAAATWLFWRAHHDLGANWSPSLEIGAGHTLITQGIYRTIRHPMYTSMLVWALAQAMLLQNGIAGGAGLAAFLLLYVLRVPREERMMRDHFGDDYSAYSARTGRILPRLRRW